jgi:aspartate/methionine/tyrosine aminotransferase
MSANPIFTGLPTTIFTAMSALAAAHKAVNLGQGFPDQDGPEAIRAVAAKALTEGPNQYAPMRGAMELRQALSDHARHTYGLDYDPGHEVVVTSGATEALADAILGLVGPGDEVLLIAPHYDAYRPIAEAAGAVVKTVALEAPHWRLTEKLLAGITPKTRAVLFNSPVNPVGRVFDAEEMRALAAAVAKTDAVVICDEVYEHLTFDGRPHIPLAALPGMRERCVRIGSAGKIFSLTGWKVGWVEGPRALVDVIANVHQFLTFATPGALQAGVAHGLTREMAFPKALAAQLQENRDVLARGLGELGFGVLPAEGTYFLTARIDGISNEKDGTFCERMVREGGVAAIPLSAFFPGGGPEVYVRFAFCKQRAVIDEALARLKAWLRHD